MNTSLHLQNNHIIQVGGVLLGDMFALQLPALVGTLHGYTDGVVAVLAVDGFDGLGKRGLLGAVFLVEQVALDGLVSADVPYDDAGFLVPMAVALLPVATEQLYGHGHQFLLVVGGYQEVGRAVDVALWQVFAETAGMGKDGDAVAHAVLEAELAGALRGEVGHGFFYGAELVEALLGKRTAGADGFLVR